MIFHRGEIEVQERAEVRAIADEIGEGIHDGVSQGVADFLALRRMAVLGTVDADNRVTASLVAGEPGFIGALDQRTIEVRRLPHVGDPLLENLAQQSHVAMLVIDFLKSRRVRINGEGRIEDGTIRITTRQVYGNCKRYIQERLIAGAREECGNGQGSSVRSRELTVAQREQIAAADTLFIATDNPQDGADVSHKGGSPGFVHVSDERHLAIPDYNGNSMFNSLGNLTINPRAGILLIDFNNGRTLQIMGAATIDWDRERARSFAGAERLIDFAIEEIIDDRCGFPLETRFRQFSRFNPHPGMHQSEG